MSKQNNNRSKTIEEFYRDLSTCIVQSAQEMTTIQPRRLSGRISSVDTLILDDQTTVVVSTNEKERGIVNAAVASYVTPDEESVHMNSKEPATETIADRNHLQVEDTTISNSNNHNNNNNSRDAKNAYTRNKYNINSNSNNAGKDNKTTGHGRSPRSNFKVLTPASVDMHSTSTTMNVHAIAAVADSGGSDRTPSDNMSEVVDKQHAAKQLQLHIQPNDHHQQQQQQQQQQQKQLNNNTKPAHRSIVKIDRPANPACQISATTSTSVSASTTKLSGKRVRIHHFYSQPSSLNKQRSTNKQQQQAAQIRSGLISNASSCLSNEPHTPQGFGFTGRELSIIDLQLPTENNTYFASNFRAMPKELAAAAAAAVSAHSNNSYNTNMSYFSNVLNVRKTNGVGGGVGKLNLAHKSLSSNNSSNYSLSNTGNNNNNNNNSTNRKKMANATSTTTAAAAVEADAVVTNTSVKIAGDENEVKLFELNPAYVKRNSNYFKYVLNQQRKRQSNATQNNKSNNNTNMNSNRSSIKDNINSQGDERQVDRENEEAAANGDTSKLTHQIRLVNHEIVIPPMHINKHSATSNVLLVRRLRFNKIKI